MDLELRPITEDEYPAYSRTAHAAFGNPTPDEAEVADWRALTELDRTLAVLDGGEIVGTAGAFSFRVTVPGGAPVPAAGVTAVTVRATHRRRGLLRSMMDRQLDDVAERGEPLALLTASESVIYGRFGYGLAASSAWWTLPTEGTRLTQPPTAGGRLRLVEKEEAAKVVPGIHDRTRSRHVGAVAWSRSEAYWAHVLADRESDRDGASALYVVVHETEAGEADGYAAYRIKPAWEGRANFSLRVVDLDATDDEVEAALWQYLLDVDLVAEVRGDHRRVDEPLRWRLDDPRRLRTTLVGDHLWLRVVDPAAALSARRYATEDELVLELADPFRPANDGRWVVQGSPDAAASAERTSGEPSLALGAGDLGALYLGGVTPSLLAAAGRVRELRPGALRRADAFFANPAGTAPWCGTDF